PVAQPSIQVSNTTVTEHKDPAVLTYITNDTGISVSWFFSDQSLLLTEKMTLSPDNSILSIDPVRREDAGDYWCEVSNPSSSSIGDPVTVVVLWRENGPALSMEVLTVIAIGVLVRVALVAALGFSFPSRGLEALVEKGGLHSLLGKRALLVLYFDTKAVTSSSSNPQDNPDLSEGQWPE
ncbi:hypothetical protein E2I00_010978, partial [Balaenoptera physalus]